MDSVSGDKFIEDCAQYIRYNEARLSQSNNSFSAASWVNPSAWIRTTLSPPPPTKGGKAPRPLQARPVPLRLTSHHLYYLLIRFEGIGIATGPLDVQIPSTSRPSSYFAFVSNNAINSGFRRKNLDDTMSVSSLQTTMSALSSFGLGTNSQYGWWGGKKPDISIAIKTIYSALTKIPALRIGPPPVKLIQDFEDCPGELSIPLDIFKNVQILEFEDIDPRAFIGWDRLSCQLRSLSIKRSSVEDITDIIVDAVVLDEKRRKGERVRHRQRKIHAPTLEEGQERREENVPQSLPQLPSLSWHFLRHLCLSDNSLTFLPLSCLTCLDSLTSLDLSNNLLNAVPPSLNLLPNLQSLNLTNNLIDSVLGIPDALPSIQALNLSQNRLESLCGLERLATLIRIDLRRNEIYEAGEVGRLAILSKVSEIYIAGNPLLEEVDDARVEVFAEFAKEGRDLEVFKIDNESIGYFERQRVREKIPNLDRLADRYRNVTPIADEVPVRAEVRKEARTEEQTVTTSNRQESEPAIKTVRHRNNHSSIIQKNQAARRNRRVVDLPQDASGDNVLPKLTSSKDDALKNRREEISDSAAIKRAALAGDTNAALGIISKGESLSQSPAILDSALVEKSLSPSSTLTKKSRAALATKSKDWDQSSTKSDDTQKATSRNQPKDANVLPSQHSQLEDDKSEALIPGPRPQTGRKNINNRTTKSFHGGGSEQLQPTNSTLLQAGNQNLRKKIEALKGEVGDDWLRVFARGESVYVPEDEIGEE